MAFTGPYQKSAKGQRNTDAAARPDLKIQRAIRKSMKIAADRAAASVELTCSAYGDKCESDAEELFLIGLASQEGMQVMDVGDFEGAADLWEIITDRSRLCSYLEDESIPGRFFAVAVFCQAPVGNHVADFLMVGFKPTAFSYGKPVRWTPVCVAVDCAEQADADLDRQLSMSGVLRLWFSEAEILSAPHKCAIRAARFVVNLLEGFGSRGGDQ